MKASSRELSRREREIMDIVYRRGRASAVEVQGELSSAPSYSAVRALLRILEEKGHLTHEEEAGRYIYSPKVPQAKARSSALRKLVETFFNNSVDQAVLALMDLKEGADSPELEKLRAKLEKESKNGRS